MYCDAAYHSAATTTRHEPLDGAARCTGDATVAALAVWRNLDGLVATAITQLLGHAPTPSDVTDIVEDMFAAWTHLTPAPDRQLVTAVLLIACQYHADRDFHVTTAIRYLATALDGLLALTARNRPQFACA